MGGKRRVMDDEKGGVKGGGKGGGLGVGKRGRVVDGKKGEG
jgi:hypothetical protein